MTANPYTTQTISGYNASPPASDGSQVASNQLGWDKHKEKLGDPLKTLAEAINSQVLSAFGKVHPVWSETSAKTGDHTVVAADDGVLFLADSSGGAFTFTLLAAATAAAGFRIGVKKTDASVNKVTIDGSGSETIDGATTVDITAQYGVITIVCDGTSWHTVTENISPGENFLINGDFRLAQRGTTFDSTTTPANSNDNYLLDRWILLSNGNDRADITQETTTVPTGAYSAIKFDVETVSGTSQQFGICQIIEARDSARLIGAPSVTLSFKARTTSSAVENLRAYVLAWDSTADSVTSDIISGWGGEGTNHTFAANWTAENTAANLALTNVYQTFIIPNIAIDTSSAVNVAVFIAVDDTDLVATDVFYISDAKLEIGSFATQFVAPLFATELAKSKRFHERLIYDSATGAEYIVTSFNSATTTTVAALPYAEKRKSEPTVTGSAAGTFDVVGTGAARNASGVSFNGEGRNACQVVLTVGAGTSGDGSAVTRDGTDTCFIDIDAEL